METNNDARPFQALLLSLNLLSEQDLCSISLLSSEFRAAARENHLWQPFVSKLEKMPLHDFVDVSAPDFPTHRDICTMFVPPRMFGEIRNHYTCDLDPRDVAARLHPKGPLVLRVSHSFWHGGGELNEMKVENGKLLDGFYGTQDDKNTGEKEAVWLERTFPIECDACNGIILQNEAEMLQHCAQYKHIANAKPENKCVPSELVDPRHESGCHALDAFYKAKALSKHRAKVLHTLRAPFNDIGRAKMSSLAERVKANVTWLFNSVNNPDNLLYSEEEYQEALAKCTLERTMKVFVEKFAIENFLEYGLDAPHAIDVVVGGEWASLEVVESEFDHFSSLVSGWEFY